MSSNAIKQALTQMNKDFEQEAADLRHLLENPPQDKWVPAKTELYSGVTNSVGGVYPAIKMYVSQRLKFFCDDKECGQSLWHSWHVAGDCMPMHKGEAACLLAFDSAIHPHVIEYVCDNCKHTHHVLTVEADMAKGCLRKIGEWPVQMPPLPKKLDELVEPDVSLLRMGYRLELMGFGVGAFAYYRRIVEAHMKDFLKICLDVATATNAPQRSIDVLQMAVNDVSFKQKAQRIKSAIPRGLLIDGIDPFTLLHNALSVGIHGRSDADCLNDAADLRRVLMEFASRAAHELRQSADLKKSVHRLRSKPKRPQST